jgi:uncharacterized membrane protein YfcA
MDIASTAALLASGFAAGTVNAVAGGGSLVTFPTLLALGLAPVPANVTNSVAVVPGYLASVFGSRTDLMAIARSRGRRRLAALLPTAALGSALGCLLLLATPERAFEVVVPFLVLGASALLAFAERLRAHVGRLVGDRPMLAVHATVGLGAVYGGYFGAALGVMMVAALALVLNETLARITALKNAVSAVVGLTTVLAFGLFGPVDWAMAAVLAPATLAGGYVGSRVARRLPTPVLRAVIVTLGTVVGVILLVRAT